MCPPAHGRTGAWARPPPAATAGMPFVESRQQGAAGPATAKVPKGISTISGKPNLLRGQHQVQCFWRPSAIQQNGLGERSTGVPTCKGDTRQASHFSQCRIISEEGRALSALAFCPVPKALASSLASLFVLKPQGRIHRKPSHGRVGKGVLVGACHLDPYRQTYPCRFHPPAMPSTSPTRFLKRIPH